MVDNRKLFDGRTENYSQYRPGYPAQIISLLESNAGLNSSSVVADIGSGTGILSRLFLENGNTVYCVEPNSHMRMKSQEYLASFKDALIVDGSSERTTLPDKSVNLIVAGQAFHWFDQELSKKEFLRILKPGSMVALIWNDRKSGFKGMNEDYERICMKYSPKYHGSGSSALDGRAIIKFFGGRHNKFVLDNSQKLDLAGLKGRYLSASYAIGPNDESYTELMNSLENTFERNEEGGFVQIRYETVIFLGKLSEDESDLVCPP